MKEATRRRDVKEVTLKSGQTLKQDLDLLMP
jgi:hypothetical protein